MKTERARRRLMNILFGYYTCDEGEIFIKGEKADLSSPKDAISRGVGMIHQHFALVPSQTVLENIIVGTDSGKSIFLDLKSARQGLLELQERFGLQIDPEARVWTLSVGEQQKVEILKPCTETWTFSSWTNPRRCSPPLKPQTCLIP